MPGVAQVRGVVHSPSFLRLYSTRLLSATADGIFQAALASYVFFSPEKATTPAKTAVALAALLLPYSLAGPFIGVFLDRWRRQRVLVVANTVKIALVLVVAGLVLSGSDGAAFFIGAVAVLGVNRLFLSALSAALPHLVAGSRPRCRQTRCRQRPDRLQPSRAPGSEGPIRFGLGSGSATAASIDALAAVVYGASALRVAATMNRDLLGPDADELAPPCRTRSGTGWVAWPATS